MTTATSPTHHSGRPIKVLLLLSSLHGGGAERVAVQLMDRLHGDGFDLRMGLLRAAGPYLPEVDPAQLLVARGGERFNFDGSNRDQVKVAKIVGSALRAPLEFRRIIREARPNVVMSFLRGTNMLAWLAVRGLGEERPAWIAREGNNVIAVAREESPNALIARANVAATKVAYRGANAVLTNSTDMAAGLVRDLALDPAKMRMIHNPIDVASIRAKSATQPERLPTRPYLLTAGRLEYQKAHEVLLQAYAQSGVAGSHDLAFLGKGSREAELRGLAGELGISDKVHFVGFAKNPYGWMARADLFVLPSRWEGFPTVAAEAMAAGAPLLLTDFRFGARDILGPGRLGELVPVDDVFALADSISHLIANPDLRAQIAAAGTRRVSDFDAAPMAGNYASLFREMAEGR